MQLSSLTLMPIFIHCSFDTSKVRGIIMDIYRKPSCANSAVFCYPFWFTIIGCLCGAYILALDWFRPYQVFPIPCLIGSCLGFIVGCLAILILPFCCPFLFTETKRD
mmetsp:Transcript_23770/g.37766  ORF Transcript_23770/g.37766 Transcript_23770/m.37766 type:complete len:107 (-) Transcript_23770:62-382(-)